jgi:hypothetical protein
VKHHERFARFFPTDFHVLPPQLRADTRPECLRDRLFARETRRQERPGRFVRKTIRQLGRTQDSLNESFAKFREGRLNAFHFDDVDACAENQLESILSFCAAHFFHGKQHFADGIGQPDHHRAADDTVADVQFLQMRHLAQSCQVLVI